MRRGQGMSTNVGEVYEKFLQLATPEMRKALKSGLRAAAGKLRTETRKQVRVSLPAVKTKNPKYSDTMYDAVRVSKVEEDRKGNMETKVHIMGTRNSTSGTYRLRFFEKGTVPRFTRSGQHYRGVIKPMWFFRNANMAWEAQYTQIMNSSLDKAIDRINKKKIQ